MASAGQSGATVHQIRDLELPVNEVPSALKDYAEPDDVDFKLPKDMKKGSVVMLRSGNAPCVLTSISKCKTGKHGKSKFTVMGKHLLTGKTIEDVFISGETVVFPNVHRDEYHVLNVAGDGRLTLQSVDKRDTTREDISIDVDGDDDKATALLANDLAELYWEGTQLIVTVQTVLGFPVVTGFHVDTKADAA